MCRNIISSILALSLLAAVDGRADQDDKKNKSAPVGAVYTMDNAPGGNSVWAFGRKPNGTLTTPKRYSTLGQGSGNGLGNQGAVILSRDRNWLFVCNAGSDEISLFGMTRQGLVLTDKVASAGHRPISLTLHGNLLYVLNAGGAVGREDNIAGFVLAEGRLLPLPGATYKLSAANTLPAQVGFTRDGEHLVVTEKGTAIIDVFSLGNDGLVEGHKMFTSPAPPPFGFSSGKRDRIFVTQAAGGTGNPGASSVSSYQVTEDGDLEVISESVASQQTAACWLVLSRDERFAYTANTPNASISSYRVAPDGSLTLMQAQAATTGAKGPVDMSFSRDGSFLYSLEPGNGEIGVFGITKSNGELNVLPAAGGLPATVNELAAR